MIGGNTATNSLGFDGIEKYLDNTSNCAIGSTNDKGGSGTFAALAFDRFLAESFSKQAHIFGHPAVGPEMLTEYFQLGYKRSQPINFANGEGFVPGFDFAGLVNINFVRFRKGAADDLEGQ